LLIWPQAGCRLRGVTIAGHTKLDAAAISAARDGKFGMTVQPVVPTRQRFGFRVTNSTRPVRKKPAAKTADASGKRPREECEHRKVSRGCDPLATATPLSNAESGKRNAFVQVTSIRPVSTRELHLKPIDTYDRAVFSGRSKRSRWA